MAISERKMKIVIENYFKAECNVNTSIREAFEKGFRIGVKKASSAQPKYEPVTVEDFAKTMSENTPYGFMAWHGEAFTLIKEIGFEICKKTM